MNIALFRFAGMVLLVGCAAGVQPETIGTPIAAATPDGETALFAAVVLDAVARGGRVPSKVDPRPLSADTSVWDVSEENLAAVPKTTVDQRIAILRRMGVESVDAIANAINATCPGIFASIQPDTAALRADTTYVRCPSQRYYAVALGLPREGRELLPENAVYDRKRQVAARGYSAVRVIQTHLGPTGSSANVSDYVMQRVNGVWTLARVVGIIDIH
jgi:hypothetical protein